MKSRNPIFPYEIPNVLDEDEERELATRMKRGDKVARDMLIEHNLALVMFTVRKFSNTRYDPSELFSAGCIGLVKGVDTYDIDRGWKLNSYVSKCIRNEILMLLRHVAKHGRASSLDAEREQNEKGDRISYADMIGTDPDAMDEPMIREGDRSDAIRALNCLGERERRMMRLRYGLDGENEHGQAETGRELGLSQGMISKLEKRSLHAMREELTKAG